MAINDVRVVLLPAPLMKEAIVSGPLWRVFGERILKRAVALCPRADDLDHQGPHLADTMQVRFIVGVDPRIEVGSKDTVKGGLSKLGLVLEGTEAHPIEPVDAQALRFTAGGTVVFAQHVDHPGTRKNEFVQKAMRQICQEVGGAVI